MKELQRSIASIQYQLYAQALLICILLALSIGLVASAFTDSPFVIGMAALVGLAGGVYRSKIYQNKKPLAVQILHQKVGDTEYSLHLLEKPELNIAEQLQLERLVERTQGVLLPNVLFAGVGPFVVFLVVAVALRISVPILKDQSSVATVNQVEAQQATAKRGEKAPQFRSAKVLVQPPAYTGLPSQESSELNISALSGSSLTWQLRFTGQEQLVVRLANGRGEEVPFAKKDDHFEYRDRLVSPGLYSIRAYWRLPTGGDSLVYQSEWYRLEAQPDLSPRIEPTSKELYAYHFLKDPKTVTVSAQISDDFLVSQAFIVATVARGSGENVKFREVKFPLAPANFKQARLSKTIDLKALDFAPGDELYYYWAAFDNREPEANFAKSDTYFIVYKDTARLEESELATMAVNVMPEYFRSQRQIIIDTEKLIAKKKKLTKQQFNSASNEIGFDQKVLRLRYGQYLGEEFETSIGGGAAFPEGAEGDLLEGFRHAHDSGEEDHHVPQAEPHAHEHHDSHAEEQQDPLAALMEQYVHAHDDGELNTYYEQSTRSLLKMALEQMWQSELHLRLYEPEEALPFEHKALEYLKSAQHKARTFVKKSGFDPPPIKEKETRLTGEYNKVNALFEQEHKYDQERLAQLAGEVLGMVDSGAGQKGLSPQQKQKVLQLGNLLSARITTGELRGWSVLAGLQKLSTGRELSASEVQELKLRLYTLIGPMAPAQASHTSEKKLQKAFWNNLK
ncbi:DUF4175 domain-containing protein [Telluribacter sp. SYSU D00476]|uniref:DUF4175 domain-containing protein n=1 Tax=Telluribacter sp. SYSU D00476 TaxID=2811430 RepID=UPI001FF40218|nr:DUF4175 domain-containing protein [Telluribacter sp. SYSU D00476]